MSDRSSRLAAEIRSKLPAQLPPRVGVAVSGGGDSMALLHLLAALAVRENLTLHAATVDHGLRPEAADEALWVGRQAAELGVSHDILTWSGWDEVGNLQAEAREARYRLLAEWAHRKHIPMIALGHTADDQAETVLMRLGRASGVTGLSGMTSARVQHGIAFLRPMLSITRQDLRDYLAETDAGWIEDPSNHDRRFDRIKARDALSGLADLGITAQSLSRVAENLSQAREALDHYTQEAARNVLTVDNGDICVDRAGFADVPGEIQRRLLIGCLAWIAGAGYPPRRSATDQAIEALLQGQSMTIAGCSLISKENKMWICRELGAVRDKVSNVGQVWDGRWCVTGPQDDGTCVRPLSEAGLPSVPDWRNLGKPRAALLSSPAVWRGDALVSAPLAGFSNGWSAKLRPEWPELHSSFLSH